MSTQNFMSYGDAETIFTDVQAKKFSTGNVSTIQSTLTATKAYAVNDPFIYNGQLYKADSAIAQGDTITIGTNASATTIEELINLHSSSGSGGHTILNGSGSAMAQRGKLQFVGGNVKDDSTNDKTVVTVDRELTQAEYDALSTAEQNNGMTYYIPDAPSSYTGTPQSMIGDAWVTSHAYAVGDYCIDGNVLYKCKTAHTSTASNRPPYASYWDAVSVASELGGNWKLLGILTNTTGTLTIPQQFKELWMCPILATSQDAYANFNEVRVTETEFYRRINAASGNSLAFIFNQFITHSDYTNYIKTSMRTILTICNKSSRQLSIAYAKILPSNSLTVSDLTGYQVPVYYR